MDQLRKLRAWLAAGLAVSLASVASADLLVEVGSMRSSGSIDPLVEARVKDYNLRLARLSDSVRALRRDTETFSMPVRVILTQNGIPLPVHHTFGPGRGLGDVITPVFENSGERSFPVAYRTLLEDVFTGAKTAIDNVFGFPYQTGTVKVLNYDADIQARYAVSGGYYVPNAPGGAEIRFPVYQSDVSASVNYIHCLMLAYMGTATYPFDAFNEGLARAATMAVARTPGAVPNNPGFEAIEQTLDSLYDVGTFYDWYNQPALGSFNFIAPNLLNTPLPIGGSTGGIFLLRYQMAGSAWAKPLAEYPGFIAAYNNAYFANPNAYQSLGDLVALGQTITDQQAGGPGGLIEGRSFSDWFVRQHVLDTRINAGLKLLVQPIPIEATGGSVDFGVFGIVANAFQTDVFGNETLLSGKSFPIYWRPDFTRFFTSAQDDVIDIAGAYGSVVPNFPSETFNGAPYRVAVDTPFRGKIARAYLPAGGFSTGSNPAIRNFYGTLVGEQFSSSTAYSITLEWVGGTQSGIPITNFAFGTIIADPNFARSQPITVRVFRTTSLGTEQILLRRVNKGQGGIALDLRTPNCDAEFAFARQAKMTTFGAPFEPYRPNPADLLQMPESSALVARYNPVAGRYDMYPVEGEIRQGLGYFVRAETAANISYRGLTSANTPIAVALQPGWNMVALPSSISATTANVQVTTSTQAVVSFAEASGDLIGGTFFRFDPDPVNPDLGTLLPATQFDPGQAYYVRCLKSEGAVMLFYPSAPMAPGFGGPLTPLERFGFKLTARASWGWGGNNGTGKGGGNPGSTGSTGKGGGNTGSGWSTGKGGNTGTTGTTTGSTTGSTTGGTTTGGTTTGGTTTSEWTSRIEFNSVLGHYAEVMIGQRANATRAFNPREDDGMPPGIGGFQATVVDEGSLYRDMRAVRRGEQYTIDLVGLIPGKTYSLRITPTRGAQDMMVRDGTSSSILLRAGRAHSFVAPATSYRLYMTVPQ